MKYRKKDRGSMKYPLELKTKVLKDYFDGIDGIRGLERTYGVKHQLILCWIKNCGNPPGSIRPSKETKEACLHLHEPPAFQDPRKELEYLRTENAYLREMLILSGYRKSGYYRSVNTNALPNKDLPIADTLQHVQEEVRYSYGAKRMAKYLTLIEGTPINHKRIARIMSEYLLNARIRKRRHPAYWYRQRHRECLSDRQCAPNILGRNFTSRVPLRKLATDVTWVPFAGGTLYLSAIMDLFNHEIISYEISTRNTTATALAPILRLLGATHCEGALLHCDRGPTYRSEEYQTLLARNKIILSYSRAGNCWDNAMMESFFGHLKCELGYAGGRNKKQGFQQLAQEIRNYIQFYNEKRIQKNLGWVSPVEYRIKNSGMIECIKVST